MSESSDKPNYKSTLNLPRTSFSMKANLVQNEPASQKRWAKLGLYEKLREASTNKPRYVFHDGPPYANGSIHLGHLLNKVLKDFVVRTKTMAGFDCPYVPGWDCHGLPIEHKVMQEKQADHTRTDRMDVRKACRKYADKFIKLQAKQMQRLLTVADYDHPYLTMHPHYEAAVLEVFADLVKKGLVYRDLKPVHWSIANQTALAEAELEYENKKDTSVYVLFALDDGQTLPASMNPPQASNQPLHLMIWTTTPWTLPANLAVAVHPRYEYGLYELQHQGNTVHAILATALADKVATMVDNGSAKLLGTANGSELVGLVYSHPFIDDDKHRKVAQAEYVTLEDGTGLVHTAPGHGVEDYQTGLREKLDIYCPVLADGTFDQTAPDWLQGKSVWDANALVIDKLTSTANLFYAHDFTHSYPHDWRSKTPVIFRATEQWFVGVGLPYKSVVDHPKLEPKSLRDRALTAVSFDTDSPQTELQRKTIVEAEKANAELQREELGYEEHLKATGQERPALSKEEQQLYWADNVVPELQYMHFNIQFIPGWGRNRMRGMLESRPDWCLSRQRAWGLPIPAFFSENGDVLLTQKSIEAVAAFIKQRGSDGWFLAEPADILADYDPANDNDAPASIQTKNQLATLEKGGDIFDVWFESGTSWNACIRQRNLQLPDDAPTITDLYLEGSDQHRGWFQTSLLPALGMTGKSPFATVLTHGFMVDKDGRKMSKSDGNALNVEDLLKDLGADVCRWWVSTLNVENDIKVDMSFFKLAGEEYRKIRNTIRFVLSNLSDFDMQKDKVRFEDDDAASLDAWIIGELIALSDTVLDAYDKLNFRRATEAIFNFCNDTLSAIYLAAVKDRLYCDKADSHRRRRTQTALYRVGTVLIRLLAPILPHTSDEAWAALEGGDDDASVHLTEFQNVDCMRNIPIQGDWDKLMTQRDAWLKAIETARQAKGIDNPMDVGLVVPATDALAMFDVVDLADLCGVSRFVVDAHVAEVQVMDLRDEPRCDRSWKRDGTVKPRSDGGMLSERDAAAVGVSD